MEILTDKRSFELWGKTFEIEVYSLNFEFIICLLCLKHFGREFYDELQQFQIRIDTNDGELWKHIEDHFKNQNNGDQQR